MPAMLLRKEHPVRSADLGAGLCVYWPKTPTKAISVSPHGVTTVTVKAQSRPGPGPSLRQNLYRSMVIQKLREYLDANNAKYVVMSHSPAFSAQEVAHEVHVPGREMAKTVMVSVKGESVMCVLPASYHIDFTRLCDALGTGDVYLEDEDQFKESFADCDIGAMPPFGNLYHVPVYVAQSLTEDEEITFNAGTHTEVIRMKYAEYARLTEPKVISFTDRKRFADR